MAQFLESPSFLLPHPPLDHFPLTNPFTHIPTWSIPIQTITLQTIHLKIWNCSQWEFSGETSLGGNCWRWEFFFGELSSQVLTCYLMLLCTKFGIIVFGPSQSNYEFSHSQRLNESFGTLRNILYFKHVCHYPWVRISKRNANKRKADSNQRVNLYWTDERLNSSLELNFFILFKVHHYLWQKHEKNDKLYEYPGAPSFPFCISFGSKSRGVVWVQCYESKYKGRVWCECK